MEEALEKEIKLTLESEDKIEIWKQGNLPVSITVSSDMDWNKRSSDNRCDSISGHAFLNRMHFEKILAAIVSSKICTKCSIFESNCE